MLNPFPLACPSHPCFCFLNPMLVDSADGVNEADEGIEGSKGMGAKKEPRHRREGGRGRAGEGEIKRDMTVTRPKTEMRVGWLDLPRTKH